MSDKSREIAQIIHTYTEQIERYENLSTWFAAFCAGAILIIIAAASGLMIKRERASTNRRMYNFILSGIFLLIPSLTTLYLYTFAMNMRKVALYRGYLAFLEKQWNLLSGVDIMQFDSEVITEFFSFKEFLVNGLGPAVMALFVVFSLIIGFGLSVYFLKQMELSRMKSILRVCVCVLLVVCVLFDGMCTYYLAGNDSITKSVLIQCERRIKND